MKFEVAITRNAVKKRFNSHNVTVLFFTVRWKQASQAVRFKKLINLVGKVLLLEKFSCDEMEIGTDIL